ncbi:hypothetical protein [Novosphingobium sp.]|uniref:hypothetical protein n=1 Tax=Novosphingobium sp. TaxID=1874826 RepID=UPI00333EF50B
MAIFRKKPGKTPNTAAPDDNPAPVIPPILGMVMADAVLRAGQNLLQRGVEHGLLGGRPVKQARSFRGSTVAEMVVGTILTQVARRSVPGAILVTGGLIAKTLRDRRRAKAAAAAEATAAKPAPSSDKPD